MIPTVENAIEIIRQLPPTDREKVRHWIESESENSSEKPSDFEIRQERFRLSMRWLRENREKYEGQWVALDGKTLLAYGTDGKKVHAEAQAKGIKTPLMHRISTKETEPFGGW